MFTGIELYEGERLPGVDEAFSCVQIEIERGCCGIAECRSRAQGSTGSYLKGLLKPEHP